MAFSQFEFGRYVVATEGGGVLKCIRHANRASQDMKGNYLSKTHKIRNSLQSGMHFYVTIHFPYQPNMRCLCNFNAHFVRRITLLLRHVQTPSYCINACCILVWWQRSAKLFVQYYVACCVRVPTARLFISFLWIYVMRLEQLHDTHISHGYNIHNYVCKYIAMYYAELYEYRPYLRSLS